MISTVLRGAFVVAVLGLCALVMSLAWRAVAADGVTVLDGLGLALLAVLTLWLSYGFCLQLLGVIARVIHSLRHPTAEPARGPRGRGCGRIALVMPIYNEAPSHILASVQAMLEDLETKVPEPDRYHLYLLSDTRDPDIWAAEIAAFRQLRQDRRIRVFYRHRTANHRRKVGNVEDFLKRWGGHYGAMLVLDADSVMSARAIAALVRRMDRRDDIGLVQSLPQMLPASSLFGRLQQLAMHLHGPNVAWGMASLYGPGGNFWGHNALIRVEAFRRCGLRRVHGRAPFGGDILSHDFVEAAILVSHGWRVEMAPEVTGSYEAIPETVADYATRDRRWAQGNLQHAMVIGAPQFRSASRCHFAVGIMAFVSSPLWLAFLMVSLARALAARLGIPGHGLAADASVLALATVAALLLVPKLLGLGTELALGEDGPGARLARAFGGLLEIAGGALLAPAMMVFHSLFVGSILLGGAVDWRPQSRTARAGSWRAQLRLTRPAWLLGAGLLVASLAAGPMVALWFAPLTLPLLAAPAITAVLDSVTAGRLMARSGLAATLADTRPPAVLRRRLQLIGLLDRARDPALQPQTAFTQVLQDPSLNLLARGLLQGTSGASAADVAAALGALDPDQPQTLAPAQKFAVLDSADGLFRARQAVLAGSTGEMAEAA